MRVSLLALLLSFLLLASPAVAWASPHAARPVGVQSAPAVLDTYTISPFASLAGACDFAVRASPNGSISYAYIVLTNLYYTWDGSAAPPTLVSTSAGCWGGRGPGVDIAFKPSGAAVVGWIDGRNAYGWEGLQLYVASSDDGFANVLAETASTLRVMAFRLAVDSASVIHAAYIRNTLGGFPYNDAVFVTDSTAWAETAVSTGGSAEGLDMAVDSLNRVHVTWFYYADLESVWYANSTSSWANVRVDTNQSSNWWDDRWDPAIAVDAADQAHIVWVDDRNNNVNGTFQPNNASLYTASTATGFVNVPLVFPGFPQYLGQPNAPTVFIDASGIMHLTWVAWADNDNLYYANSTNWNVAYRFTDQDAFNSYNSQFPTRPVVVGAGGVSVFFGDPRTGTFTIWRKSDWSAGPDVTPPVVAPRSNLTLAVSRLSRIRGTGAWDDDKIASWNWTFVGPTAIKATGFLANVTFLLPGLYISTLAVADPAGNTATTTFNVTAVPVALPHQWALEQPLFPIPTPAGTPVPGREITLSPFVGHFPLTYTGAPLYATLAQNGSVVVPPATISDYWMSAAATDPAGNVYLAGFNQVTYNMEFMALDPQGVTLVSPKILALNGTLPQQPSLVFASGHLWLAWSDQRNNQVEIYLAELSPTGSILWGPTRVSLPNVDTWYPTLALAGDRLWIVYTPTNLPTAASVFNLSTMSFAFQDVPLPVGYPWSVQPLPDQGIAVAWAGGSGNLDVSLLAANGSAKAPAALLNFNDGGNYFLPQMTTDRNGAVRVVWWDVGNWTLYYSDVAPNGTASPTGGMLLRTGAAGSPGFPGLLSAAIQVGPDGFPRVVYMALGPSGWQLELAYYDPVLPVPRIAGPSTGGQGHPIVVSGNASTDNMKIAGYAWDFGDASTANGSWAAHAYAAPGTYTVTLTVTDEAGNTNSTSVSLTVWAAPVAAIIITPAAPSPGQFVVLDGTGSSVVGGTIVNYSWSIPGGTPSQAYGAVVSVRYSTSGTKVATLTVTDDAGHTGTASVSIPVGSDTTPPVLTTNLSGPLGAGGWYTGPTTLTLSATDTGSGVSVLWVRIDGGAWQNYTGPLTFSDGRYVINVTARDVAGNARMTSLVFKVDATPPSLTVDPLPATLTTGTVTISWQGTDSLSGIASYAVRVDNGSWQDAGTNASFQLSLPDGAHTILVRAVDHAGNAKNAGLSFRIDTNPFSPSGPFSGVPTYAILAAAAVIAAVVLWRRRKRPSPAPPQSSPESGQR